MENITVGIVSSDQNFAKALGLSLMSVCDDFIIRYYDTRLFISDWNAYKGDGTYSEQFDIILWDGKEVADTYCGNIILLVEKASMVKMDFDRRRFSLYKYCGAVALTASLFEIYTCLTGRGTVFIRKDKVSLIAFGSWEGGAGCSTITLAVAQEMRRFRGNRVLVISLETVESTSKFFGYVPELKCIGEYLYRVLPDEAITGEKVTPFIDSYIVRDLYGIEAFAPSKSKNPLVDLDKLEIQKFIASLIDSGRYDAILIDMGTCLTDAAMAVVEMAGKTCFVTEFLELTKREEMYLSHVLFCTGDESFNKAVRLTNKCRDKRPVGENPFLNTHAAVRRFDAADVFSEPHQIMLEGAFGEDIRKLTEVLLKE